MNRTMNEECPRIQTKSQHETIDHIHMHIAKKTCSEIKIKWQIELLIGHRTEAFQNRNRL